MEKSSCAIVTTPNRAIFITKDIFSVKMPSKINKKKKLPKYLESKETNTITNKIYDIDCKDVPKVTFRINPDLYTGRITRRLTKLLNHINDFIIIEVYRCMPLLGDEEKNVPDWTVHIVRYDIVFIERQ